MQKNAVMVNSSANLPRELMDSLGIICVPNEIRFGNDTLVDDCDPARTLQFFQSGFDDGKVEAEIIALEPEAHLQAVKDHAMLQCDNLLLLAPLRDLSVLYDNATKGLTNISSSTLDVRMKAGRKDIMRVDIDDTRSLFSPYGLLGWEAGLAIREGLNMKDVRARVAQVGASAMGYYVIDNGKYIYNRARDARDKPNAVMFAVGTMFDVKVIGRRQGTQSEIVGKSRGFAGAAEKLFKRLTQLIKDQQLVVPRMLVSYSGNLDTLEGLPGFFGLRQAAKTAGVELVTSVMSLSGGVFMGAGGVAVGLSAKPHKF